MHPLVPMAAPRTVWRIRLQDGAVGHCVLWERRRETAVVWYRDEVVEGLEEFEDRAGAEEWVATPIGPGVRPSTSTRDRGR